MELDFGFLYAASPWFRPFYDRKFSIISLGHGKMEASLLVTTFAQFFLLNPYS